MSAIGHGKTTGDDLEHEMRELSCHEDSPVVSWSV